MEITIDVWHIVIQSSILIKFYFQTQTELSN